jgi:hypothetical protein
MFTDRRKRSLANAACLTICLGLLGVAHANGDSADFLAELKLNLDSFVKTPLGLWCVARDLL